MGPNAGNGVGGMDMGPHMHAHGSNQPPLTEYTLQGVMRFLQTEWHRHERDRNAWEIERQEMRGRIANLEGQARRADATQKALRKYVSILETKVKDQAVELKGGSAVGAAEKASNDRAAQIQQKLKATSEKHTIPGADGIEMDRPDDEAQRQDLKAFLDQCQSEFMYLMITPANPQPPPRESPPLPIMEDLRDVESFGNMPGPQSMERQYPIHSRQMSLPDMSSRQQHHQQQNHGQIQSGHLPLQQPKPESQPHPMVRSNNEPQHGSYQSQNQNEWRDSASGSGRNVHGSAPDANQAAEALSGMDETSFESKEKHNNDSEGWEFPEGAFPEPGSSQQSSHSNRPDTDVFPDADSLPKSPNRLLPHHKKSSSSRRRSMDHETAAGQKSDSGSFKLRYGLRGHLDTVRAVIFSGGGSPGEPEICTAGDDGMIKRFHIPHPDGHSLPNGTSDLDVTASFTHRGHTGAVLSLTSWSQSSGFATGGRALGDGWLFSGGQDATIRVWERGRVDPKATLDGHTDAVWALCVLPTTLGAVFGSSSPYGSSDRILLVSGGADGSVRLWSVSGPPRLSSPQPQAQPKSTGRGGRQRGNSMSSGSGFPSSPQPTMASNSPFSHTLIHNIPRSEGSTASPTSITPLGTSGESFVVSYSNAAIVVYNTRAGEAVGQMDSMETYDGTVKTGVNAVVAMTTGLDQSPHPHPVGMSEAEQSASGPTGGGRTAGSGVEGTIISGHEDSFVRFFDANSGQCTYNMLAHPDAISSMSLSPDGLELVTAGHDASLRFWSLEKRTCTQEITAHRAMRGEGACSCVWSRDGKWVISGGGDGMVKVFTR